MENFKVDLNKKTPYDDMLAEAEARHGLPPNSLKTVMMIENRNNPNERLTSPAGAKGLMQVMPYNLPKGADPFNPQDSIEAGATVLSNFYAQYNDPLKAIAAYNGGNKQVHRMEKGLPMTKQTSDYAGWAAEAMGISTENLPKPKLQREQQKAEDVYILMGSESNNPLKTTSENHPDFMGELEQQGLGALAKDAQLGKATFLEGMSEGFKNNVTGVLLDKFASNILESEGFKFGDEQSAKVKGAFQGGLDSGSAHYISQATSDADLDRRIESIKSSQSFAKSWTISTGLSSAPGYLGNLAGGVADPAMLAVPGGIAGGVAKGLAKTTVGKVVGHAIDGAVLGGVAGGISEKYYTGEVSPEGIVSNMALGAAMGGGFSLLGRTLRRNGMPDAAKEADAIEQQVAQHHTDATPEEYAMPTTEGQAVDFPSVKSETVEGPDGALISGNVDHVINSANSWDEGLVGDAGKVHDRRAKYYGMKWRNAAFGWLDSEGLRLAKSENKVSRWLGAHLSGDQSGLGKQVARNAAVSKEVLRSQLAFKHVPTIKDAFLESLTPQQALDFAAGGAKDARSAFSKAVQLERTAKRQYKLSEGNLENYETSAPIEVQKAANALDDFHEDIRKLRIENQTDGYEALRDSESVGYIEQSPDYIALNRASPEKRRALFDMIKEDYVEAGKSRIDEMRGDKDGYIESMYEYYNSHPDAPGINAFLTDPDKFFVDRINSLESKITLEMERRAGHWWENALSNPEERYQNSEATLLQLVREMSQEHFEGRLVDKKILDDFKRGLTEKWADRRRREFNMGKYRDVNGDRVHLLDMFKHDILNTTTHDINGTSGSVALAKLGWRTQQDIDNTIKAMRVAQVPEREIQAARTLFDEIQGTFKGVEDQPTVRIASNLMYGATMGKLPLAQIADVPAAIANLGVSGMLESLGAMGRNIMSGRSIVKDGKITHLGADMRRYLRGLEGRDHELWTGVEISADGNPMDTASMALGRSAAAARLTNTLSGANLVSRAINGGLITQTEREMFRHFKGAKALSEARLADVGLHPENIKRIKEQFDKYSTEEAFGLDRWDDPLAKEDLIGATYKYAYQTNMDTSLAGDNPKWVKDNLLGALFSKFRVIGSRAQERMLVRNATIGDSNTLYAMVASAGIATTLAYARIHLDAHIRGDSEDKLKENLSPLNVSHMAMTYMSIFGLGSEASTFLNLVAGGGAAVGNDTALTGYVAKAENAAAGLSKAAAGTGEWGKASINTIKLLPGSNTYGSLMALKALQAD